MDKSHDFKLKVETVVYSDRTFKNENKSSATAEDGRPYETLFTSALRRIFSNR